MGCEVTIPKNLQEKRDKLAEQSVSREFYELHEADARVRHFKYGFDSAFNLLLPEIENMVEAIELIIKSHDENLRLGGEGFLNFELIRPARLTLQSLREFLGKESEGKNV